MALNLSTLTSPATSGDVLAEALTTADFLEPVPVLRNLARGSQKGGDAKQSVSLNQPRALPLIKNPSGNLGGYLYIPNVTGNYATGPSVTIGSNQTWQAEVDMLITQNADYTLPFGGGAWTGGFGLFIDQNGRIYVWSKGVNTPGVLGAIPFGTPFNLKYGYDGTSIYFDVDGVRKQTLSVSSASQSASITHPVQLNQQTLSPKGNYAIQKAKLTVNNAVVFDCDFNGSTSIRHGDTKFQASVGGPVTINQAGNDPATVIKKPVLRFDGADDGFKGLFDQTITDGAYMFAAFSVLGSGGDSWGRVFTVNKTGGFDYNTTGNIFSAQVTTTGKLAYAVVAGSETSHLDLFDDENGDILHQVKVTNSAQSSLVNGADFQSKTDTLALEAQEFNIGKDEGTTTENAAIDLEYLALFPATITDAQAADVVNYINNRNLVFLRHQTDGYYFYDAQSAPVGAISSGSSAWNGRIVGSDNGDTDKLATQATSNDSPVGDGFKVTFADNSDHLDIPSTTQAGWQVVGTSLGTFAYRVNANAVTELNLLGNLGNATYRQAGQSYGMILLPESATGADIEAARKLLIDRGAADGTPSLSYNFNWYGRTDIVEFNHINTANLTSLTHAWNLCTSLEKFPALDLSNALYASFGWANCSSLSSFGAIDARNSAHFTSSWQNCSALTSFPSDALLGTEANNVNFTSAWQASGLTSFSTPLPTGGNFVNSWFNCPYLIEFNTDLPLATIVYQAWFGCSGLTDFNTDLSLVADAAYAWYSCPSLSSFDTLLPSVSRMTYAWYSNTSLTDFSADVFSTWNPASISNAVFNGAWANCTALTAQSVENILVSIDASNQHGTDDGTSTGNPLGDSGIDIDYNTATGSLSAATNSAVTSLKSKGWSIIVNNVTL